MGTASLDATAPLASPGLDNLRTREQITTTALEDASKYYAPKAALEDAAKYYASTTHLDTTASLDRMSPLALPDFLRPDNGMLESNKDSIISSLSAGDRLALEDDELQTAASRASSLPTPKFLENSY